MDKDALYILEQMIDRYGVAEVLSGVSYICSDKAERTAVNWQNTTLGKQWMRLSELVDNANMQIESQTSRHH